MTSDTSLRPKMTPSQATTARSGAPRIQTAAAQITVAARPSKAISRRSALIETIESSVPLVKGVEPRPTDPAR